MRYLLILCLTLTPLLSIAKEKFPGIKDLMTDKEVIDTGVSQLSPDQIAALNAWLIRYTANEADLVKKTTEVKKESFQPISSKIEGVFRGWSGKTKFKLENGQIWQQRYNNKWTTKLESPEVQITRNALGFYNMKVLSKERVIGVKRIQ